MHVDAMTTVTVLTIASTGLLAGIVFTFSNFAMKALAQLPSAEGIRAMQRINLTIINPLFVILFIVTPAASAYLFIAAWLTSDPGRGYVMAGSLLYVTGVFVVTAIFNVPRNNALAKVDPGTEPGAAYWERYQREWMAWNHVRTVAAAGSTVLLSLGLVSS